jgi:hypothetical protein
MMSASYKCKTARSRRKLQAVNMQGISVQMNGRWAAATLLEAERRFHRVKGYQEIGKLKTALESAIDSGHAVA